MLRPAMRSPLQPIMHSPLQARRRGSAAAPSFAFEDLFQSSEPGVVFDIHPSMLWQDSARTVAVTADGDPVACIDDTSGNANNALQITAGKRPLYRTDGTLHWLEPDGLDDAAVTATINAGGADKATIFAAIRMVDTGIRMIYELSSAWWMSNGAFSLYQSGSDLIAASHGTTAAIPGHEAAKSASGDTVLVITHDISGDLTTIEANGVAGTPATADQGAGSFGDYSLNLFGRNNTSELPSTARLYSLTVRFAASTAEEKAAARALLAQRSGVTLP
jgi:hypothetical protein